MKKLYLLMIILCISCKKEEPDPLPIIVYPLSYLPVYPGSYWKYLDQNGDTTLQTTSDDYVLNSYAYGYANDEVTDPAYVPYWNGIPVYGYSSPLKIDPYPYYKQVLYLSETYGQVYKYDTRFGTISRYTVNTDTTMVLFSTTYSHVIIVNDYYQNPSMSQPYLEVRSFYAKDIGLIVQETTSDTIEIVSYYINR
jgi:hypothetical protein